MVPLRITVVIDHAAWRTLPGLTARLKRAAAAVQAQLPARGRFPATATLLLTDNKTIRQLNRDFRGLDKPTNVLSFPQHEPAELSKSGKSGQVIELGDMAIAYQYVVAEAKAERKLLMNHLSHLLIHGLLHLFGYDHLSERQAGAMEGLERTIMASMQLPDPYAVPAPLSDHSFE